MRGRDWLMVDAAFRHQFLVHQLVQNDSVLGEALNGDDTETIQDLRQPLDPLLGIVFALLRNKGVRSPVWDVAGKKRPQDMIRGNFTAAFLLHGNPADIPLSCQNDRIPFNGTAQVRKAFRSLQNHIQHMFCVGSTANEHSIRGIQPVIQRTGTVNDFHEDFYFFTDFHRNTPFFRLSYHIFRNLQHL